MTNIDSVKFGTLGKLLCAIGCRSHGYEIHRKTRLSLRYIYDTLPVLVEAGLLKEAGYESVEGRKYVTLTESGRAFADVYNAVHGRPPCRIAYTSVLFDLDGVIFQRPWDDSSDERVAVSTWNLLFERLNAYDEHERLKKMFVNHKFKSYNDWTNEACRTLQARGLTRQIFYEVINGRKYNVGVKETLKTILANGVTVGVVTGSFYELAERIKEDFGLNIDIYAHCRLEFDGEGSLKGWEITPSDYKDKATYLKLAADANVLENIAYVGDDVNDIEIFGKVGLSIAFNAIKEKVKRSAKVIVEGNDLRNIFPHLMAEPLKVAPKSPKLRDS